MTVNDLLNKLKNSEFPDSDVYISLSDGHMDSVVIDVASTEYKTVIFARRESNG